MNLTEKIKEDIRNKNRNKKKSVVQSVVQEYYNATKETMPIQSANYKDIEIVVNEINAGQREFEKIKKRADAKGMIKMIYGSYDVIAEKAGFKKQYISDLELFDNQINNVDRLNHILAALTLSSGRDLKTIERRINGLIDEEEKSFYKISEMGKKVPELAGQYKQAKEKFDSMKKSDDKYFSMQRHVLEMGRELDSLHGGYMRVMQSNVGNTRHKDNMIYMEKLFRTSLNTAANLAVITKQIGDTLVDNQRIYSGCDNIFKASAAVSEGLDILADYNKQLSQRFTMDVKEMQNLIYNRNNINMIEDSNNNLRTVIENAKSMEYKNNIETENIWNDE